MSPWSIDKSTVSKKREPRNSDSAEKKIEKWDSAAFLSDSQLTHWPSRKLDLNPNPSTSIRNPRSAPVACTLRLRRSTVMLRRDQHLTSHFHPFSQKETAGNISRSHLFGSASWLLVATMCHYMPTYQNENWNQSIKLLNLNPSPKLEISWSFHHDLPSSSSSWDGPEALVPGISWISFPMEDISTRHIIWGLYILDVYIYIDAMMEENVKTPRSMATSCHFCFGVRNRTEVSIMEYRIHHWHDANAMTMQSRM